MQDPFERFADWFKEAEASEDMAEAMSIATVDEQGRPSIRMVLLKDHGPDGFTFYTNLESRKGKEIAETLIWPFAFTGKVWRSKSALRAKSPR